MALSVLRIGAKSLGILERNAAAFSPILKNNGTELAKSVVDSTKNGLTKINYVGVQTSFMAVRHYSKNTKHHKAHKSDYKSDSDYHSSSDSDNEVLGHLGESEFWRRKIRTFHGILDVNKDGVISYDDFKLLADRFVNLGHLTEKQSQEFQNVVKNLWIKLWGEITPYNLVTVERYLEDMHHVVNDKALRKKAHAFLPFLFKAIDKGKAGKISVDDFKLFFECLGLNEVDAVFSFRTIDTNGDGKITMKEFVTHGRQFFLTEDLECISKYFWGPLVDH